MLPNDFLTFPWDSVTKNWESETVARNIISILSRTGNTWRTLSWDEYKNERLKDGSFSTSEKAQFDKVVHYCTSSEEAGKYSFVWRQKIER